MNDKKKYIVQGVFILVAVIMLGQLFSIQILDKQYKIAAISNITLENIVYPYRGNIYDRNGNLIVSNKPVFDLKVVIKDAEIKDTARFCEILGITQEAFDEKIRAIKGKRRGYSPYQPMDFIKTMSVEEFSRIEDVFDYKGFLFVPRTLRSYPQSAMANALGYVAEISESEIKEQNERGFSKARLYYVGGDYIGKSGLEKMYEDSLRGVKGVERLVKNVKGQVSGSYKDGKYDTLSVSGLDLRSTIDIDLQLYGEQLMQGKVGSIVAIQPSTGEILSIVTSPSYDPNILAGKDFSQNFSALVRDSLKPLFDRAVRAPYPPGSIFKLVQALVALDMGVITKYTQIYCGDLSMGDHAPAGYYDVHRGVMLSSNHFFAKLYKKMLQQNKAKSAFEDTEIGYDIWREYMLSFGLGEKLNTDIPHEKTGRIPTNEYYDRWYGDKSWKSSTIISNGIGQGEISVVPIQMANIAAIMANRGYYYTPHLVKSVGKHGKLPRFTEKHYTKVSQEHYGVIVDAMEDVVNRGTATLARIDSISVCGKTGTAENPHGEDHSVFIAFAPKENPQIAIAVYVENAGYGGTWAAPIASLMMEKYIKGAIPKKRKIWFEKRILDKRFYE